MVVIVGLALWAGWLFRFEGDRGLFYLDRWRGELVDATSISGVHYRHSLHRPLAYEAPIRTVTHDREGVAQDQAGQRSGAFNDLIPNRGRQ
ncbi:hypothetical protein [Immundisolibacter sp.]|uniref:hypothetical protein n=1 Tax=Immundisolibacter sp. TaxID=1934948 RepID=UPI00260EBEDC|nr:hypothetical protein [Immundisolibacter sp.]MDD3651193.1 hypothetical protein [Immundisolibacter sp.]